MILATEAGEHRHIIDATNRIERRKHRRIEVIGAADGILAGPRYTKWVQILDISRGGLSFCYAATHKLMNGSFEVDILSDQPGLELDKLKIEVVSDVQIGRELFLGFIPIRRCGAKFTDLTAVQIHQLAGFLEKFDLSDTSQDILPMFPEAGRQVGGWV